MVVAVNDDGGLVRQLMYVASKPIDCVDAESCSSYSSCCCIILALVASTRRDIERANGERIRHLATTSSSPRSAPAALARISEFGVFFRVTFSHLTAVFTLA